MAKIRITGDTSEIKKSILDLSKDVKNLGQSKVTIFDKEQKDFLTKEAGRAIDDLKKKMETNTKEIKNALKIQNRQHKSVEDEVRARERVTKLIQRQVKLQKEMNNIQTSASDIGGRGGLMGRLGGIFGRGGGMKGMGMLGGLARFAGPLGLLAGTAGFAGSRMAGAAGVFQEGIQDRIALRGRGVGDMDLRDPERAARAGMNAQSVRRARLQAMDVFGERGATQEAVLQRAEVERNFGIEKGTLTQLGGQLRGQFGGEQASKQVMTIQASLIASGITDEIGPYLETAANMLTALNENGFTFTDSAMAVLNNLATQGVGAERAGRIVTGVDQAIRGSQGEANAFFQQVFKGAGIGGETVGGLQAAIRSGGLFGANIADNTLVGATDRKAFEELGIGGRTGQRVAQSTMGILDTMFGSDQQINDLMKGDKQQKQAGATRRLQRMNFIMNTFGLENEVQASEVNTMLRQMADPKTSVKKRQEIEKQIKDMQAGNTELGNLKLITKSTEGTWDAIKNQHQTIKDVLGGQVAPAMMSIDKTMMKLDAMLSAMLDFFGIETEGQKMEEAASGKDVLDQTTFDQLTMNDPKKQEELSKKMAGEFSKKQERLKELKAEGADKDFRIGRHGERIPGEKMREMMNLKSEIGNMETSDTNIRGLQMGKSLSKEDRMALNQETVDRFKEEQKFNQSVPGQIVGTIKEMFSGLFDSDEKKPAKKGADPVVEQTKALQELVTETKDGNQTRRRIERQSKKSGALPVGTERTN